MTVFSPTARWMIVGALALFMVSASAVAQERGRSDDRDRDELKQRFKQRDAELTRLKRDGAIGETWQGYVEAVPGDRPLSAESKTIVDEENADRRTLYERISSKSDIRESPADIGMNNALRNFASAKPNEYLKVRTGPWVTRGDVSKLKADGKIGETWQGYVDAVTRHAGEDPRVAATIIAENLARKYVYERQARDRRSTVEEEAQRAGRRQIDDARRGEFIRERDGQWVQKK